MRSFRILMAMAAACCSVLPAHASGQSRASGQAALPGTWTNGYYTVALSLQGPAVSGAFAWTEGTQPLTGKLAGTWDEGRRLLMATWSWQRDGLARQFRTSLVLSPDGIMLSGVCWGLEVQEEFSAFSLRRVPAQGAGEPLDEDALQDIRVPQAKGIPASPMPDTELPPAAVPGAAPESRNARARPAPALASSGGGEPIVLLDLSNTGGVLDGPRQPTTLTLSVPHQIALVRTYHWNGGRGAPLGTVTLVAATGERFGPWQTQAPDGGKGVAATFWDALPNVVLPAGTYTVVTSSPATWSYNASSGNRGFVWVHGYAVPTAARARGAEVYSSIPDSRKRTIFFEGFDDNRRRWATGPSVAGTGRNLVENGHYVMESFDDIAKEAWRSDIGIDAAGDFEIETSVTFARGQDNYGYGLLWGGRDRQNEYRFLIAQNGHFKIQRIEANLGTDIVPWRKTDLIRPGAATILTMRKVGDTAHFFVDGALVHSMPFPPFFGPQIGFQCSRRSIVRFDYLKVSSVGR